MQLVPIGDGRVFEPLHLQLGGIVDENIDVAVRRQDILDNTLQHVEIGQIHLHERRRSIVPANLRCGRFALVEFVQDDRMSAQMLYGDSALI